MSNVEVESVFAEFPARGYLEKYYSHIGPENDALLRSIADYIGSRDVATDTVIEVAGGPCLYSMLTLAALRGRPFDSVTFTDVGRPNLAEVDAWLSDDPEQFGYAGLMEWLESRTGTDPARAAADLRASDVDLVDFDWRDDVPDHWRAAYDVVAVHFFAESATSDEAQFMDFLAKLADLGRPGGTMLLSCITRSNGWVIDGQDFPSFGVDRESVLAALQQTGLRLEDVQVSEIAAEDPASGPGYEGLLFVAGRLPERPRRFARS